MNSVIQSLLDKEEDSYMIFRLKGCRSNLQRCGLSLYFLKETLHEEPDLYNYDLVGYGMLDVPRGTEDALDWVRERTDSQMEGFQPLMTGDIVLLKVGGQVSLHYCDTEGFAALPAILLENFPSCDTNLSFPAAILNAVEEYLEEKGVSVPNADRDKNGGTALFYDDYLALLDKVSDVSKAFGIRVQDEW